ncbi:peptidase family M49-domain-containing protein [Phascolomyces articulosus]|uniref:Dipeptidyl peptidase 3 n=1 Tax=Phascolomyces articulosus TaxID=60185 RepID=A0AAD5PB21_9FUNG|nr:peptidase family M49-domain-containing protein [Phascolomyces articulosus]
MLSYAIRSPTIKVVNRRLLFLSSIYSSCSSPRFPRNKSFLSTMTTPSRFLADEFPPYSRLEAKPFFESLSNREKHYAHYMSRASFEGTRVIVAQTNPNAIPIYNLILDIFRDEETGAFINVEQLGEKSGVSKESFEQFLQYSAQFLGNLSNYKSFGDEKFIPRIPAEDFEKIVQAAGKQLTSEVKQEIYNVEKNTLLGFPEDGHLSGYYSQDMTKADIRLVQEFLEEQQIEPLNTRVFKTDEGYKLVTASSKVAESRKYTLNDGKQLEISFGDFQEEMAKVAENIRQAAAYGANEHQTEMCEAYYESFTTGSVEAHMESQRHWLKDLGPNVETNIGFVETYRDPQGVRAEWEGFVAMVNKEQTIKFGNLVDQAPTFVSRLPWPSTFERETINKPDFTSLEVLAFATGGVPAGINIPNYTNITQVLGSKNVSLGNVISAQSPDEKFPFIKEQDLDLYRKYRNPSFEVQVGTHELGHGTGKLFHEESNGEFNFDKDTVTSPLTNELIHSWYKPGQTFNSTFKAIASSYEECRAECIALTLSHHQDILDIFGYKGQEAEDVVYVMYLNMARAGLMALEFYDPEAKKWGQAHMQGRYAIFNVMLKAGQDFVTIEKTDNQSLEINMDRSKIRSVGAPAVADFLAKLQIYKATADEKQGTEFYLDATSVPEDWKDIRETVLRSKQPRKVFVQGNTFIENDQVVLKEYEPSAIGMIQSMVERRV